VRRASPDPTTRSARAFPGGLAAALAVVAFLGLGALLQPFTWDQAVFALGAERLLAGGRLYMDYWDFKQPGIFWFFALGGHLFGTDERGVHVLELLWMLALGAVTYGIGRGWLGARLAAWAPIAACGFYYAVAGSWQLLQVEGLVGLPLALSLAASARAGRARSAAGLWWIAAGVAGGAVLVFKLVLAPVLVAIWAVPAGDRVMGERAGRVRAALAILAPLALGILVPVGATVAVLARQGSLGIAWWTWVVFPANVMGRLHGLPVRNLESTARWLGTTWPLLLLLAGAGAAGVLGSRTDRFGRSLLAWVAAGVAVFLLQRWSGWQYQMFVVLVPLALLALRGVGVLADLLRRRWPGSRAMKFAAALLAAALVVQSAGAIRRSAEVLRSGALVDPAAARELLARRSNGTYAYYARLTAFLAGPDATPGPICVLGNPLAYWMSGRMPALAMPGGMSIWTAREWSILAEELAAARPPYILLEDPMATALADRRGIARPFLDELERRYRPGARMGTALWLVRV